MKYLYGKRIKTLKDRVTTLVASLAILANSAGVALPILLTQRVAAATSTNVFTQTELDTNWEKDRYFPTDGVTSVSAFGRTNVARLGVDSSNTQPGTFQRTEGIKTVGAQNFGNEVKVDLYIDPAWQNTAVRAGLWVVGDNGSGARDSSFGIIEFINNEACDPDDCSNPSNLTDHEGFRIWDSSTSTGWKENLTTPFTYGTWMTLGITLNTTTQQYIYSINGTTVGTAIGGGDFIREIFLNSYNYGQDNFPTLNENSYAAHWHVSPPPPVLSNLAFVSKNDSEYSGIFMEFGISNFSDATDVYVTIERENGGDVVKRMNPAKLASYINDGVTRTLTVPFPIIEGTYAEADSSSWAPMTNNSWNLTTAPTFGYATVVTPSGNITGAKIPFNGTYNKNLLSTPSTNEINKSKTPTKWAHVNELSKNVGSVELEFVSERGFSSCFEYRTDGDISQVVSPTNPNTQITDGQYPDICLNNDTEVRTISANEYVEVRMVYGAEKDERFNWTRFDVLEDTTPPAIPTNLSWTPDSGTPLANGSYTNIQKGTLAWQNTDPDVDHYTYHFWTNIPGYYEGQSNAWSTPDGSSYITQSPTGGSIWTDFYDKEGTYYFCVEAVDTAGNRSNCSEVFSLTFDQKAPNAEITSPIDGSVFRGGTLTVTGSVSDTTGMSHYSIYLYDGTVDLNDGEVHGTSRIKLPGTWTAGGETSVAGLLHQPVSRTLDLSVLDEGEYQIRLAVRDLAGNRTAADSVDVVRFTVDKTPPSAPKIITPGARTWHKDSPILNSWTEATDNYGVSHYQIAYNYDDGHVFGGTNTCKDDPTIPAATGFVGCRDVTNLYREHKPGTDEQGGVTIWVRAIDKAGNKGPWSKPVHYYYDSVAPVTSIVAPTGVVGNNFIISGEASDNLALNRVYVQLNKSTGGRFGGTTIHLITNPFSTSNSWSKTYDVTALGLADGDYRAHVSVTDMAGNTSSAGWTDYFTVDTTAPVVLVDDIDEINTGSNAVVTGSIDDPSISSVEILVNSVLKGTAVVTAGAFSFDVPGLGVGNHNITVRATDDAGNVGEDTKSVSVGAVESAFTNTPGGSEEAPNINTASTSRNPSTTSNVTITDNNSGGDTLVEQTAEEPEARVLQATDTANGSDTSGENETEENNGCGKFLGLCWYLWIPIVIAVLGTIYYVSSRRADEK